MNKEKYIWIVRADQHVYCQICKLESIGSLDVQIENSFLVLCESREDYILYRLIIIM